MQRVRKTSNAPNNIATGKLIRLKVAAASTPRKMAMATGAMRVLAELVSTVPRTRKRRPSMADTWRGSPWINNTSPIFRITWLILLWIVSPRRLIANTCKPYFSRNCRRLRFLPINGERGNKMISNRPVF